jgi:hypothetical protein
VAAKQITATEWLRLIRSEYLEIPGLQLTRPQVQRLWGLEPDMCDALLETLVASEFLRKTRREAYVLGDRCR